MTTPSVKVLIPRNRGEPDFSWLAGRGQEIQPPWSYKDEAMAALSHSRLALDVDTGGGEVLKELSPFPGCVVATEGYLPNVAVAAKRLNLLGVAVLSTRSAPDNLEQYPLTEATPGSTLSRLPFRDQTFDLVLDRHSSYWPSEVRRVLTDQGLFLTQQRSLDATELLGSEPSGAPDFDLDFAVAQLENQGFRILRAEEVESPMSFFDIGAFVYYLRAVPWVAGFRCSYTTSRPVPSERSDHLARRHPYSRHTYARHSSVDLMSAADVFAQFRPNQQGEKFLEEQCSE